MRITLLFLLIPFFNTYSQSLVYPKNNCSGLRERGESYAAGDNYKSYCDFEKKTRYVNCMCSFEQDLAAYKRERKAIENQIDNLESKRNNTTNQKRSYEKEANDVWFNADRKSESFESDKETALRHYGNALDAAKEVQSLEEQIRDLKSKIYSNTSNEISYGQENVSSIESTMEEVRGTERIQVVKIKLSSDVVSNNSEDNTNNEEEDTEESEDTEEETIEESSSNSYNPAKHKTPEQLERERQAENRANRERIAQQKREEEERKKRKFYEDRREAANQRHQTATAMGASSIAILVQVAAIMYKGMGNFNVDNTYFGNQLYGTLNLGYSATGSTVSAIKEELLHTGKVNTSAEEMSFSTLNLDLELGVGYEADYYGSEIEFGIRPGFLPLFTQYNFSRHFKTHTYFGLKKKKIYFEYQYGARRWFIEDWVSEIPAEASVLYNYDRLGVGLRQTWVNEGRNYNRSHLIIGFIWDRARKAIKPDSREISTATNFKEETASEERERNKKGFLSPFYPGFSVEWHKEHWFKAYLRFFGSYPLIGPGNATTDRENGSYLVEFGFVRQIKSFRNKKGY